MLSLAGVLGSPAALHAQGCAPTFSPASFSTGGSGGSSVVTADLDGDGDQDAVVVSDNFDFVSVFLGNGAGGFSAPTSLPTQTGAQARGVVVAEVTGDAFDDIVIANANPANLSLFPGAGGGTFGTRVDFTGAAALNAPQFLAAADLNGDGSTDLAVSDRVFGVSILLNDGLGNFTSSALLASGNQDQRVVAADLDGDGDVDLAVASRNANAVVVYLNDGTAAFTTGAAFPVGTDPQGVAVVDLDRDGIPDLVVTSSTSNSVALLHGTGGGSYTAGPTIAVGSAPLDLAVGDVNGDAIEDLVVADGSPTVLVGDGKGGFSSVVSLGFGGGGGGSAIADLDAASGKADLLLINGGSLNRFLNTSSCSSTTSAQNIQFAVARSGNASVTLQIDTPHTGPYSGAVIRFAQTGPGVACTPPASPGAGTAVAPPVPGYLGAKQTIVHGGLTNGDNYCYSAFPLPSPRSQNPGAARTTSARPFVPVQVQWAYNTAAAALATPAILPGSHYLAVSNDSTLHGIRAGAAGGTWPPLYTPVKFSGPAHSRPTALSFPTTTVQGVSSVAFAGSQDGHVYAVDAGTGKVLWVSANLGAPIEATPSVVTTDFGGVANLVLVGTHDTVGANRFYALRIADGTTSATFDNTGNGFGIVSSQAQVVYPNRVIFTSRTFGSNAGTVWSLQISAGGAFTKQWQQDLGPMDAAPNLRNGRLYLGDVNGMVYARDPVSGGAIWTLGPVGADVKGFVWKDSGNRLYFSTTTGLHAVRDDGGTFTPLWDQPVTNASTPLVLGANVYVGGAGSTLFRFDSLSGASGGTVQLGDPGLPQNVGAPTYDARAFIMVVGTEAGDIYTVGGF